MLMFLFLKNIQGLTIYKKMADLSESPEYDIPTPNSQNESGPSKRIVVNPIYASMSPLGKQLFTSSMPRPASPTQLGLANMLPIIDDNDDNDTSGVEYMGVEMSPLSTRGQRASRGTQL